MPVRALNENHSQFGYIVDAPPATQSIRDSEASDSGNPPQKGIVLARCETNEASEEYELPEVMGTPDASLQQNELRTMDTRSGERRAGASVEVLDERMMRLEKSIVSVLSILKKIVRSPSAYNIQQDSNE